MPTRKKRSYTEPSLAPIFHHHDSYAGYPYGPQYPNAQAGPYGYGGPYPYSGLPYSPFLAHKEEPKYGSDFGTIGGFSGFNAIGTGLPDEKYGEDPHSSPAAYPQSYPAAHGVYGHGYGQHQPGYPNYPSLPGYPSAYAGYRGYGPSYNYGPQHNPYRYPGADGGYGRSEYPGTYAGYPAYPGYSTYPGPSPYSRDGYSQYASPGYGGAYPHSRHQPGNFNDFVKKYSALEEQFPH